MEQPTTQFEGTMLTPKGYTGNIWLRQAAGL